MFFLLLIQMLWPAPAMATSALYLSDDEQAARSNAVVLATIESTRGGIDERTGQPTTHTTIRVGETLVGDAPETLEIEQFGGERDGRTMRVPGDASFEVGERCVLFLRHVDGGWYLTAMGQSKYGVEADGTLTRNLHLVLWTRDGDGHLEPYRGEPTPRGHTLDKLRAALGPR